MASSNWMGRVIVLLLLVGLTASRAAAQQTPAKIAPHDQVTVTVFGTPFPVGPYPVDTDGSIDYPYLGRLKAAGLTARELGAAISRQLVAAQVLVGTPQVTVELQQTANKTVTVSGAVNNKGEFKFAGDLTVFSALIRAGGAAPDAGDEILLIRAPGGEARKVPAGAGAAGPAAAAEGDEPAPGDEGVITLSRRQIESGAFNDATLVQDGDRIIVRRARQVYIDGQVSRPGGYTVDSGTTLRQALSLAGGVTELGATNRIRVLRGGKKLDKVDLDTTIIQPGDTITVPKRFM